MTPHARCPHCGAFVRVREGAGLVLVQHTARGPTAWRRSRCAGGGTAVTAEDVRAWLDTTQTALVAERTGLDTRRAREHQQHAANLAAIDLRAKELDHTARCLDRLERQYAAKDGDR